jgi:glucokinase
MTMLIAGDIGGTKTNLGLYSREAGPRAPLHEETFSNAGYSGLTEIVTKFLARAGMTADHAVFGIAGPVLNKEAAATNVPWVIRTEELTRTLRVRSARLLNDLEAMAWGVPLLQKGDLLMLHEGKAATGGALGIIAPGTGLGEAFLTREGESYRAHSTEGGHADFAPTNDLEIGLLQYLLRRYPHVSYERVCSGLGIPNVYEYLKEVRFAAENNRVSEKLARTVDQTPIIIEAALDPVSPCRLCRETIDLFVSILGAEAGNLALKVMATGGIYLGGGIPIRLANILDSGPFMEAFLHKGRFSHLMERIPVHVILNPKVALIGAAACGLNEPTG